MPRFKKKCQKCGLTRKRLVQGVARASIGRSYTATETADKKWETKGSFCEGCPKVPKFRATPIYKRWQWVGKNRRRSVGKPWPPG